MNEVEKPSVNILSTGRVKIDPVVNNNDRNIFVLRKESQVSLSSVSDYPSDDSEDNGVKIERKTSLQELGKTVNDKRTVFKQRGRSMSDGETRRLKNDDSTFEAFPSPSDAPRQHMNEEELEEKFANLALALTIDATTIKDRCERQRRSRDQTETNLNAEIEKLREKLSFMQPFCKDYEKAEIFSTIMTQLDIIMNAASLASMSAERFGSVQHEERFTESVGLMVSHVQMLKQQRDATRRQLQYTKRVLQNSADSPTRGISPLPSNNHQIASPTSPGLKIISKRRASIATFTQQPNEIIPNRTIIETKKITRRPSDLILRTGPLNRRPTRLELGGELVKIKEGYAELSNESDKTSDVESEEMYHSTPNISSPEEETINEIDISKLPLREQLVYRFTAVKKSVEDTYNTWTHNGKLHEIYTFGALICFSLSVVLLLNILTEYEYAKRGIMPWFEETQKQFSNVKN